MLNKRVKMQAWQVWSKVCIRHRGFVPTLLSTWERPDEMATLATNDGVQYTDVGSLPAHRVLRSLSPQATAFLSKAHAFTSLLTTLESARILNLPAPRQRP